MAPIYVGRVPSADGQDYRDLARSMLGLLEVARSIRFVESAAALARRLQPSMVVLEDVDLIAMDRDFSDGATRCCSHCSTRWTGSVPTLT